MRPPDSARASDSVQNPSATSTARGCMKLTEPPCATASIRISDSDAITAGSAVRAEMRMAERKVLLRAIATKASVRTTPSQGQGGTMHGGPQGDAGRNPRHTRQPGQSAGVEHLEGVDIAGHHTHQIISLAGHQIAFHDLGHLARRRLEG